MILLFEGHGYPKEIISPYLTGLKYGENLDAITTKKGKTRVNYVGYFTNSNLGKPELIFILPKVFLYTTDGQHLSEPDEDEDEETEGKVFKAFGLFDPESIITYDGLIKECKSKPNVPKIVDDLSTWIYLTIRRYKERNPNTKACIGTQKRAEVSKSRDLKDATLMDLVLALIKFANDNKNLFTFVYKNIHSGYDKINWKKTISKEQPFLSKGNPIYLNPVVKKKSINSEEELFVIFFSLLEHIHRKFHKTVPQNSLFKTMSVAEYEIFETNALSRLRALKHKYYTDKTVELWNLLYQYYDIEHSIKSNRGVSDFLLVKSFHVVFEDMIDYLISDDKDTYPKELKEQLDGKTIDHIYKEKSLTYEKEIYFIGDSKYYKDTSNIEVKSIQKQYTYAKNIIQRNINVLCGFDNLRDDNDRDKYFQYRDDLTEGYNITPNFFISGFVKEEGGVFDFKSHSLEISDDCDSIGFYNRHFENRLFDRDTLLLQHYNINFLFVLNAYVHQSNTVRNEFNQIAKKKFKTNFIDHINTHFNVYTLIWKKSGAASFEDVIDKYFRRIVGKIYRPNPKNTLMFLALDKAFHEDNIKLLNILKVDFEITEYNLGSDPKSSIQAGHNHIKAYEDTVITYMSEKESPVASESIAEYKAPIRPSHLNVDDNKIVLVGYFKNPQHLDWIHKNNAYNTRHYGAFSNAEPKHADYLLLYTKEIGKYVKKESWHLEKPIEDWDWNTMNVKQPYPQDSNKVYSSNRYFIYKLKIGSQWSSDEYDIDKLVSDTEQEKGTNAPVFITVRDLKTRYKK